MTLESTIQILELAMKDRLQEADESLLREREIQHTLTTFFAEQKVRPDLTSSIKSQSLMYEYLKLSLEEREELDGFRKNHEGYLDGEGGEEFNGHRRLDFIIQSGNSLKFAKKLRYVNKLLTLFSFYLENREENQIFNRNYLRSDPRLKERFGRLGSNLCQLAVSNFRNEGFLDVVIELASEINPEIRQYTTFKEVLKIDGVNQLIRMFDFYLENREEGDVFNIGYLIKNKRLREKFGNLGMNLGNKVRWNLPEEGGFNYLFQLAIEKRPEIRQYTTFKETLKIDGVNQLIRMFDFYLENREEGETFNVHYLTKNKKIRSRFGNLGVNIFHNAKNNFKKEGSIRYIIQLATQQRPEILEHWKHQFKSKDKEGLIQRSLQQFYTLFDFYLENREEGVVFNSNYLKRNEKLREKFGNIPERLYFNLLYNLKAEGGINYITRLAKQQRPDIIIYSDRKEVFKIDGVNQLIRMFDFYLENRQEGDVLNVSYLENNPRLKERFGRLGVNLCRTARKYCREEENIQCVVQLASRQRPEILEHWRYDEKHARRKNKPTMEVAT